MPGAAEPRGALTPVPPRPIVGRPPPPGCAVDEMLCDDSEGAMRTEATLLGGYLSTADIVEHLTGACGVEPTAIHAPARYGLPVF